MAGQELELSPRHEQAKQLLQRARMKARTNPLRASHDILLLPGPHPRSVPRPAVLPGLQPGSEHSHSHSGVRSGHRVQARVGSRVRPAARTVQLCARPTPSQHSAGEAFS